MKPTCSAIRTWPISISSISPTRVCSPTRPAPTAPSSPNLLLALELAGALGFLIAILTGFGLEAADQSVKNGDELEDRIGFPAIASIPTISKRMMRMMPAAERHPSGYLDWPADVGVRRSLAGAAHRDRLFEARQTGESRGGDLGAAGRRQDHGLDVPCAGCGDVGPARLSWSIAICACNRSMT